MLKRSKKILLEGTLAEFKNYPRGAEGREYVLMNIEEKGPDGSYAFYEKDEKGDIISVSYKGAEGYDATEFIQFTDPEFKRIILANFNTNPKGGITTKEADAITNIGQLFKGNTALVTTEDLALLKQVQAIPATAFQGCTNLQTAIIPKQITTLGNNCFDQCSNLKTVKAYGDASINYYQSLGSVNLDLLECYGNRTLNIGMGSNTFVSSIFISNNTKIISAWTFQKNNSLTELNISSSINTIEQNAIEGCSNLVSITVDKDNNTYDSRNNCNGIIETATNKLIVGCANTIIPNSVTEIGERAFYGCTSLTSLVIPSSVTTIGQLAFRNCTNLTSIVISSGVINIQPSAFYDCTSLSSIELPSSIATIGGAAFYNCTGLTYIKCYGEVPASIPASYYGHPFYGSTSTCTLYVPINSLEAYQTADYWKDFQDIVGFEPEV